MRVENGRWQINTRDISHGHYCLSHCLHLAMAVAAEEDSAMALMRDFPEVETAKFIKEQGNDFESLVFEDIAESLPSGDFEVIPDYAAKEQTAIALRAGIPVIGQAPLGKSFGNVDFGGRADLLVREDYEIVASLDGNFVAAKITDAAESDKYTVWDVKHSKSDDKKNERYSMQIAMMAESLRDLGHLSVKPSGLLMRNGAEVEFSVIELIDRLQEYRSPILEFLDARPPILKGELAKYEKYCKPKRVCREGSCDYQQICSHNRREFNDASFLRVWHSTYTPKIESAGLLSIDQFVGLPLDAIPGLLPEKAIRYIRQAEAIVKARDSGNPEFIAFMSPTECNPPLKPATQDDLYFDFEFLEPLNDSELHYFLGGYTTRDDTYSPFVSWDKDAERVAMTQMIKNMANHLRVNPYATVYHFHHPEKTGIETLGQRFGLMDDAKLILTHLYDLMRVVEKCVATSQKSQSLKSLEIFLGEGGYGKDVEDGDEARFKFYKAQKSRLAGQVTESDEVMESLMNYHRQDCVNTRRLHEWLLTLNA